MSKIETGKVPAETLIYALAKGETERYTETLMYGGGKLLTQSEVDRVIAAASADGWHSFRVTTLDLSQPPTFGRNVLNL